MFDPFYWFTGMMFFRTNIISDTSEHGSRCNIKLTNRCCFNLQLDRQELWTWSGPSSYIQQSLLGCEIHIFLRYEIRTTNQKRVQANTKIFPNYKNNPFLSFQLGKYEFEESWVCPKREDKGFVSFSIFFGIWRNIMSSS